MYRKALYRANNYTMSSYYFEVAEFCYFKYLNY